MRISKLAVVPALVAVFALGACTAEKTEEGEMPEVNVEGGNLPEYDVDAADVEITTDTQQIVTPDVDIKPPR
jgi:hypothetical protein